MHGIGSARHNSARSEQGDGGGATGQCTSASALHRGRASSPSGDYNELLTPVYCTIELSVCSCCECSAGHYHRQPAQLMYNGFARQNDDSVNMSMMYDVDSILLLARDLKPHEPSASIFSYPFVIAVLPLSLEYFCQLN